MTNLQNAKLNMYQSVLELCKMNSKIYAEIEVFASTVKILEKNINDIRTTEGMQKNIPITGVTKRKQAAENHLVELTLQVANATYVFAVNTGNDELKKLSTTTRSKLYRMEGNALLSNTGNISENAKKYIIELKAYGINNTNITELNAAIVEFQQLISKPRDTTLERKGYTEKLSQLFTETNLTLYDKMDKLIELFKSSAPNFYDAYKDARNLIDTASRRKKDNSSHDNKEIAKEI